MYEKHLADTIPEIQRHLGPMKLNVCVFLLVQYPTTLAKDKLSDLLVRLLQLTSMDVPLLWRRLDSCAWHVFLSHVVFL